MRYVDPVPYRGDGLLQKTVVVFTVAMLWSWGLGVSNAQEMLNSKASSENCLLKLGQIVGCQGYVCCDNCPVSFQMCPLKSAAVALLMA